MKLGKTAHAILCGFDACSFILISIEVDAQTSRLTEINLYHVGDGEKAALWAVFSVSQMSKTHKLTATISLRFDVGLMLSFLKCLHESDLKSQES